MTARSDENQVSLLFLPQDFLGICDVESVWRKDSLSGFSTTCVSVYEQTATSFFKKQNVRTSHNEAPGSKDILLNCLSEFYHLMEELLCVKHNHLNWFREFGTDMINKKQNKKMISVRAQCVRRFIFFFLMLLDLSPGNIV